MTLLYWCIGSIYVVVIQLIRERCSNDLKLEASSCKISFVCIMCEELQNDGTDLFCNDITDKVSDTLLCPWGIIEKELQTKKVTVDNNVITNLKLIVHSSMGSPLKYF